MFDAQTFANSSVLSLLQNIYRTLLASMSTSRLIYINANALKRFWPIDAQRYVFILFKTIPDLSHLHEVVATVPENFSNTYIFGYEPISQVFSAFATKSGWSSWKVPKNHYNDKQSSFNELLEKDGSVSIHEQNLQFLATEMYKISNGLPTPLMKDIFPVNGNPYNLRQNSQFSRPRINTVYHGTESISNLGPKIWDLVPCNLKEINELDELKKAIKQWKPEDCPCRFC